MSRREVGSRVCRELRPQHVGHGECADLGFVLIIGAIVGGFSSINKEAVKHVLDVSLTQAVIERITSRY